MTLVGFVLTVFASSTAGFLAAALLATGTEPDDDVCSLCADTGNWVAVEAGQPPKHQWCVCLLGRFYTNMGEK